VFTEPRITPVREDSDHTETPPRSSSEEPSPEQEQQDEPALEEQLAEVQWVKKLSQCLAVLEGLTWHKSSKLYNNLKIIYVILGHLSFQISFNSRDLEQN
jgi:hypothetical protein